MLYRFLRPEVPGFWPSNGTVRIPLISEDMLVERKEYLSKIISKIRKNHVMPLEGLKVLGANCAG